MFMKDKVVAAGVATKRVIDWEAVMGAIIVVVILLVILGSFGAS